MNRNLLAAILSLCLPGAGQIYRDRVGRGLLLMVALTCGAILSFHPAGYLLMTLVWAGSVLDAWQASPSVAGRRIPTTS